MNMCMNKYAYIYNYNKVNIIGGVLIRNLTTPLTEIDSRRHEQRSLNHRLIVSTAFTGNHVKVLVSIIIHLDPD